MKPKLKPFPPWARQALQGVAYWIGHRRCLYRDYPLSEGALVAEICNLIYASLPRDSVLLCEVQYSKLLDDAKDRPTELQVRSRVDLMVAERSPTAGDEPTPKFIIEVKRAAAPKAQINMDLRRLAALRTRCNGVRAFLFLISEAARPERFVDEEGKSRLGRHRIPESDGHYRVRRTWKAAHAFTKRDRAQYACLIEVYPASARL